MDVKSKIAKNYRSSLSVTLKNVTIEPPKVVIRKVASKR